jgi:hypothetical protein
MKLIKPLAGAVLAVALAACLWLWFHRSQLAANSVTSVTRITRPNIASLPASLPGPVPTFAPKMTVVAREPVISRPAASYPAGSDWSAAQVIADTGASYEVRLGAISSLSPQLTDADWGVLQKFLLKPDLMDGGQLGQVIKNQLLDKLCALNPPPAGLGDVLTQMYRDHQQGGVIRDYAVQHLAAYYEQMSLQRDSAQTEQAVQKVLWEAVDETSDSIGGTALLALQRLSQEYGEFDPGKIATMALRMANDNNADELTHITAYQVCAQLGATDSLPVVLQAALNGETTSVRMSAIGALGLLGGSDQVPFLSNVLEGTEDRFKPAAQHALDQIAARQSQVAGRK